MSDPRSEEQAARDEQVESLHSYYDYAKDEEGYEGSVSEQWVQSSAETLNWAEITDWLADGDADNE